MQILLVESEGSPQTQAPFFCLPVCCPSAYVSSQAILRACVRACGVFPCSQVPSPANNTSLVFHCQLGAGIYKVREIFINKKQDKRILQATFCCRVQDHSQLPEGCEAELACSASEAPLGDSTLSLLSLSSLSAKWDYPPTALHHIPTMGIPQKGSIQYSRRNITEKVKQERKKKWFAGAGVS